MPWLLRKVWDGIHHFRTASLELPWFLSRMMPAIRMFARKMEQWVLSMFCLLAGCHGLLHAQRNYVRRFARTGSFRSLTSCFTRWYRQRNDLTVCSPSR
jgi:hypothetical protein